MNFEHEYSISLNDKNGRDAASSILTTVRNENNIQLALAPYYYFTSSIYEGECSSNRVALMTAKNSDTPLYLAKINGEQVYELVGNYLADLLNLRIQRYQVHGLQLCQKGSSRQRRKTI